MKLWKKKGGYNFVTVIDNKINLEKLYFDWKIEHRNEFSFRDKHDEPHEHHVSEIAAKRI